MTRPAKLTRRDVADDLGWTEADLQREVLKLAALFGWRAYHTHDSRRSHRGFPDLTLVRPPSSGRPGRVIFAELKSDRRESKPTPDQLAWLEDLGAVGGTVEAYLWRPADLQAIAEALR